MRIDNADIILNSQRQALQKQTVKESLRCWIGDQQATESAEITTTHTSETNSATINLSDLAKTAFNTKQHLQQEPRIVFKHPVMVNHSLKSPETDAIDSEDIADPKLKMIKLLFEKVFGTKFTIVTKSKMDTTEGKPVHSAQKQSETSPEASDRENWGLEYNYSQEYIETERTTFSAQGIIQTTAGQKIKFELDLNMSHQFATNNNVNLRLGDAAKDPLIINFDGMVGLTEQSFTFDLNADGTPEEMAFVKPGNGFLAIDRNEDNTINDGSELFGPTTGDGFTELALYDIDRNQWIDENDPVFYKLKLWGQNEKGTDQLFSLADKGVGAIYLKSITSEFSLKDSQNNLQGQVRSSSMYVTEGGTTGTIQQVDLVI